MLLRRGKDNPRAGVVNLVLCSSEEFWSSLEAFQMLIFNISLCHHFSLVATVVITKCLNIRLMSIFILTFRFDGQSHV